MVRVSELALIEDELSRQLSFAKRRNGLIKKALELFVVCNVDCVFISFSPSGRLSYFIGDRRVEEVLARFASAPENISFHLSEPEFRELIDILHDLKERTDQDLQNDRTFRALQREISRVKADIESVTAEIRDKYEPSPESIMTLEEANTCEANLEETLAKVQERMKELSENQNNDALFHPSASENLPENPSDESLQIVLDHQPGVDSGNNHAQLDNQSPAIDRYKSTLNNLALIQTVKLSEKNLSTSTRSLMRFIDGSHKTSQLVEINPPPQSQFSDVDSTHSHRGRFSSLLMSPFGENAPQNGSMPFLLSSQPAYQGSGNSFIENQFGIIQDTHQFYQNGHLPEVIQSSYLNGSTYETTNNGYVFPDTNNYYLPFTETSFQIPHQNGFQTSLANGVSPYYPQMVQGESSRAGFFNGLQWSHQRNLQSNSTLLGQRGSQESLTPNSDISSSYSQDGSPRAYYWPNNLLMNNQSMGNNIMGPNLALNLQGPLSNGSTQGFLGYQMQTMQGNHEAVEAPFFSNKRKFPWEQHDDIPRRLTHNQNMNHALNFAPPPRILTNAVYNTRYEMMGLPIDPHLRMFMAANKTDFNCNNHQQPNY